MRLDPAHTIIEHVGGLEAAADLASSSEDQVPVSRVRAWRRAKGSNGTGGHIPLKYMPRMLTNAASRGIDLQPGDFVTPERINRKRKWDGYGGHQ